MLLAEYRSLGGMRIGTPLIYRKKMVVTRNFEFILIQLFTLSTIQVYIGSYLIRLKSSRHQWALRYEQEPRKTRGYGPTRDPCAAMCHHASWAPTLHSRTCHVFTSFSFETTATPIWWWVRVIHPAQVILYGIWPMWSYPRQALLQYYCKWFGRFIPKDTFDILNKYGMTCANIEY